jgi:hypothetical protein
MYLWLRESLKLLKAYLAVGFAFGICGTLFGFAHIRGLLTEQQALVGACVIGFAAAQVLWSRINRPVAMVFVSQTRATESAFSFWAAPVACAPVLTFTLYLGFASTIQAEVPSTSTSLAGGETVSISPIVLNI